MAKDKNHQVKEKPFMLKGIDLLKDSKFNKDLAFSLQERQMLGIHGLLPAQIQSQEHQVAEMRSLLRNQTNNLDRYNFLLLLLDRNEKLFYRLLSENIAELLPVIYTPTIAVVCQNFEAIYPKPSGLYITVHDAGYVQDIISNWSESDVRVVIVSDGCRVLGLGDLGTHGMGVVLSKMLLYTVLGGVTPAWCLPVMLDVGTSNPQLTNPAAAASYTGLRHGRIHGKQYHALLDEFMEAVVKRFGRTCLVHFEDFSSKNSLRFLQKYQHKYSILCDDIQGTASVAVAGILAALRSTGKRLSDNKIMVLASGMSSVGICNLLSLYMREYEGVGSPEDAAQLIWVLDADGLIITSTTSAPPPPEGAPAGTSAARRHYQVYAKDHKPTADLLQLIVEVQPAILIGCSGMQGAFTENVIRAMSALTERPIIFALSNPHDRVECTATEAYNYSQGNCIFASGCMFSPVTYKSRTHVPSQANSIYVFPAMVMAAVTARLKHIDDLMHLVAAKKLSELVSVEHLSEGRCYPGVDEMRAVSVEVSAAVLQYAYSKKLATVPLTSSAEGGGGEPVTTRDMVHSAIYDYHYHSYVPPANAFDWA